MGTTGGFGGAPADLPEKVMAAAVENAPVSPSAPATPATVAARARRTARSRRPGLGSGGT